MPILSRRLQTQRESLINREKEILDTQSANDIEFNRVEQLVFKGELDVTAPEFVELSNKQTLYANALTRLQGEKSRLEDEIELAKAREQHNNFVQVNAARANEAKSKLKAYQSTLDEFQEQIKKSVLSLLEQQQALSNLAEAVRADFNKIDSRIHYNFNKMDSEVSELIENLFAEIKANGAKDLSFLRSPDFLGYHNALTAEENTFRIKHPQFYDLIQSALRTVEYEQRLEVRIKEESALKPVASNQTFRDFPARVARVLGFGND